jgi:hypothetical protein
MDIDHSDAAVPEPPPETQLERDLERELDELQRESSARHAELRSLAERLPAVTSRRATVRAMTSDIVHAPDRVLVVKRVALKIARTPSDLVRRVRNH